MTEATARRLGPGKEPVVSALARWCVRTWLGLFGRPIRVLGAERLSEAPVILQVCHPASFTDALVLTAVAKRPLTCVISRRHLRGYQWLVAPSLGMVCYESGAARWHSALRACTQALALGGIVAEFQEEKLEETGPVGRGAGFTLAQQAWSSAFPDTRPVVLPVYQFRPPGRSQEILIHVGEAVGVNELTTDRGALPETGMASRDNCRESVFLLDSVILKRLLCDFEQALRDQLQEEWALHPARKQKADSFRLSPAAAETLRHVNQTQPESLLELRQLLEAEHKARRRCALAELKSQLGRNQISTLWRALTWVETVVGLPVALYGAVNHLVAGLLFEGLNVVRRGRQGQATTRWIQVATVLACYAGQIIFVDHVMGRAAAGYYAVALPLSGAYLWRYRWLLRRRTHILLLGARASALQSLAERYRKRLRRKLRLLLDSAAKRPRVSPSHRTSSQP